MKRLLWWAGWGCSLIILIDLGQAWYIASHGIDWGVYREFDRSFVFGSTVPLIEPWFNLVLIIGAAVWLGQQTHAARRDAKRKPQPPRSNRKMVWLIQWARWVRCSK